MKAKIIGLVILIVVILSAAVYWRTMTPKNLTVVNGYLGGEKIGLFEDAKFAEIMAQKGYKVSYSKAGSLDMISADKEGKDYLFPSSQTALDLYNKQFGKPMRSEIIFNTPIVLYTWDILADAMIKDGLVTEEENGILTCDMVKLVSYIEENKKWADIGLPQIYGNIAVHTTDPRKSNSGNMFAGLLANALNGGKVATETDLPAISERLKAVFDNLGYMESSSGDLFAQFLKTGAGAKPMIAGYESQLLELSVEDADTYQKVKEKIKIIYPIPTVWSSHVYIALNEKGRDVIDVLTGPEIQQLAWEKHGFRTGIVGSSNPTDIFPVVGLTDDVTTIISMPDSGTMEKIIELLQ